MSKFLLQTIRQINMADSLTVSIFLPHQILNNLDFSYIYGFYKYSEISVLINCSIFSKNVKTDNMLRFECNISRKTEMFDLLGVIYCAKRKKSFGNSELESINSPISFILRFDCITRTFHIENMLLKEISAVCSAQVVLYDNSDLLRSNLLFSTCSKISSPQIPPNFVLFLIKTLKITKENLNSTYSCTQDNVTSFMKSYSKTIPICFHYVICLFLGIMTYIKKFRSYIPDWISHSLMKIATYSSVSRQLLQRFLHCEKIAEDLKSESPFNLTCKNLMCSILLDLVCGWWITFMVLQTNIPLVLLGTSVDHTNQLVSGLQMLIQWLMGAPAGLKLNISLNSALGHFFLYHIYLWQAYMTVVLPVFTLVLNITSMIGILGFTFVLCLLSDLISLATIHIYCFYGYATRLYGYQMLALSALWRLFRGKKWNPLRQRVDSYTFDIHQLFLGTLIFTVLLFLLPTVMVYYFVFTCLRILVLIIQGVISKIIYIASICPLYSIFSRLCKSSETAGDVSFTVFSSEGTLTLSMQVCQVSLATVIKATLPEMKTYEEYLSWKSFFSSVIWGKIIYPL